MGSPDVARISRALERPGIDPRSWFSLAIVTRVSVESAGIICDVTLLPSKIEEHAAVAPEYGGARYGLYCPIEVDQMVVVAAPEGNPAHGLRIVGRCWDGGEPPPQEAIDHPTDFVLVVKKDGACRIVTDGDGDVIITAKGTGKVLLGGEEATRGVARLGDDVALSQAGAVALQSALDARYTVANPLVPLTGGTVIGAIATASDEVKST